MMAALEQFSLPSFRQRLQTALWHLGRSMSPLDNLSCLQVWMPASNQAGIDALQKQLYSDPELYIMGSPAMMPFRVASCQSMQFGHQGMPGRVLRSGCVQVVQNLRIIPEVLHPRCRLPEALACSVGEVLYIPVFDLQAPQAGCPVAVLEALLSATATDSMLVANFISVVGNVLSCMQLSLSNPLPQPVRRSKLEGRKPRPVHPDSSQDLTEQHQQPQPAQAVFSRPPAAPAPTAQQQPMFQQPAPLAVQQYQHRQQQHQQNFAAGGVACGVDGDSAAAAKAQQQQQQLTSCSSGSAGTITTLSVGTPNSSPPPECTLSSTLSSRLSDSVVCGGQAVVAAGAGVAGAAADMCCAQAASPAAAAAMMLPPRPCAVAAARAQHRRRWQQDQDAAAGAGACEGSEDGDDMSPPPCKLRRTLSMVRTKSVHLGLDQVLAQAMATEQPAVSC